ncbi:MAG TPA: site-specific integrase, partial [Oceanospirillaceae bacterium]|nr:site-specific integrase [Oceanospirillaceae bacterium]
TLYGLRHTFGTNAGNNKSCNPFMLSSYMGHSNVKTTQRNYFHGGIEDAQSLVKGLKKGD